MQTAENRVILVIGAPGAGKGTLCKKLAADYGLHHISVGDALREAVRSPDADKTIVEHVQRSELLPTELLFSVLRPHLVPDKPNKGGSSIVLLDGFPRRLDQTEAFEQVFGAPLFVLFFDCPESLAEERVVQRQQGRQGDNLETFKKRYREYAELNPPILHYYQARDMLVTIETSGVTEVSYGILMGVLDSTKEWMNAVGGRMQSK